MTRPSTRQSFLSPRRYLRASRASVTRWMLVLSLGMTTGVACREHPEAPGPEEAVQAFIDNMQRVHGDIERARSAYALLSKGDRDNLAERARRASAVAGRTLAPEEMLAPSRFYLEFQPTRWSSRDSGNYSIVTAFGQSADQRREIRCVKEADGWKVLLELPGLSPIERRDLADPAAQR